MTTIAESVLRGEGVEGRAHTLVLYNIHRICTAEGFEASWLFIQRELW